MSKSYSRAQTPTTSVSLSKKSLRHKSSKDSYDHSTKSYRSYDKYEEPDAYDRPKYDKSYKNDRFDKFEKTNYKSSSSDKNASYDPYSSKSNVPKGSKYAGKSDSSYREVALPYKAKGTVYAGESYSDRDQYLAKFSPVNYSKPYTSSKDILKHPSRSVDPKRYSPYSNTKPSSAPYSSKYGASSSIYEPPYEESYSSYADSRRPKVSGERGEHFTDLDDACASYNYQRFVVGNSVNYKSPGHYPKESYPPSPKSKVRRSFSPSFDKPFSRFTPPRYRDLDKGSRRSPYSHRSPHRRPPSPPPPPIPSYRHSSPHRFSRRNYTPPPDPDKRFDSAKGRNGRDVDSHKFPLSRDYSDGRRLAPVPKPMPLLSIPLSLNNVPRESRANLRETLGIDFPPKRRFDKTKGRRFEGRIGQKSTVKKRPLSPKDNRRRRPDDLRLWIESRKTEGTKRKGSPRLKRDRGNGLPQRSRLLESRTRIRIKGKRKTHLPLRTLKRVIKGRRPLPLKNRTDEPRRSRERTKRKESGATDTASRSSRMIKRPRVISKSNSLPVKAKPSRRSPRKSRERSRSPHKERSRSHQRERNSSVKSEKTHHHRSKSRERSQKRDKSREIRRD